MLRGRLVVAAVAAGALATAGHGVLAGGAGEQAATVTDALALRAAATTADDTTRDTADTAGTAARSTATGSTALPTAGAGSARPVLARAGTRSTASTATARTADALADAATTGVLPVTTAAASTTTARSAPHDALAKSRRLADAAAAREAAARAPAFVRPAEGRFTSGFGARWGTSHNGVDIANAVGTPIVSVAAGTVVESGPASGFGMWVRVRLEDGTITVYGHVNRSFVSAGQTVKAGEKIAEIGNRGQSTGPHLHFEVWTPSGRKVNPLPWLAEHGISLGPSSGGGSD